MDSRSRYLREGIIAGLIAAAIVAVWFLIYDAARGQPFRTPALLGAAAVQGMRDPGAVNRASHPVAAAPITKDPSKPRYMKPERQLTIVPRAIRARGDALTSA